MWADNETAEDLLGFKVHADLLLDVINDDKVLPVTIGVFGDWGSGKSSILKIVYDSLKSEDDEELKDDTLVLYFNGWVFEGYDDAKAALLESIVKAFKDNKKLGAKIKDEAIKLVKSVKWMRLLGLGLKKIVLPGVAAYATGGLSLAPYLAKEFSSIKPEDIAGKLQGEEAEEYIKSLLKEPEDETTLVREFRDDFKELIDKSKIKKLVVIIDDLDRCSPDRIIENLEAIKLFLNVEKTAFLIGADPRIVRHAIEYRYKTQGKADGESNTRIVDDYLEKLIQIPYNLPKLSDSEVETYISLLVSKKELPDDVFAQIYEAFHSFREKNKYSVYGLAAIKSAITPENHEKLAKNLLSIPMLAPIITQTLYGNPRQVKRFLNTYTLRQRLAKVANIQEFDDAVLAKLMVLEYSEPLLFKQLYDWQIEQKGVVSQLKKLEEIAASTNYAEVKKSIEGDEQLKGWSKERIINWLKVEPQLHKVDLSDYFWLSRDRIASTIPSASLIPPIVREIYNSLKNASLPDSASKKIIQDNIKPLGDFERNSFFEYSVQMVIANPRNSRGYKIFHLMIDEEIVDASSYYAKALAGASIAEIPAMVGEALKRYKDLEPIKPFVTSLKKSETTVAKAFKQ